MVQLFVDFALLGAEWVLYLLVALSVLSVYVMIDRGIWLKGRATDVDGFVAGLRRAWRGGDLEGFARQHQGSPAVAVRVALAGIAERGHGPDAVAEAMQAERARWRKEADRHLIILGTLGNNTPFVGLFGTVLGIIGALDLLEKQGGGGDARVMGELSKALVATAVGLMVAIPAVIAFNLFNRRVKVVLSGADEAAHAVLGLVYADAHAAREVA